MTIVLAGVDFSATPHFKTFSLFMESCFTFLSIVNSTLFYTNEVVPLSPEDMPTTSH